MKKAIIISLLCMMLAVCGCAKRENKTEEKSKDSNVIYVSDTSVKPVDNVLIEKKTSPAMETPDGSISFEKACELLDTCSIENVYTGQSLKDYKKYYFGTVDYKGGKYYSIYPYIEYNGGKVFVGTNCLVSCSGNTVLAKNWMGGYEPVDQNTASLDKDWKTRCLDAEISPNEALLKVVDKQKALGLDRDISAYVFETNLSLSDINGVPCYLFTPKLEYTDHQDMLGNIYVSADGKGIVFRNSKETMGEYEEVK